MKKLICYTLLLVLLAVPSSSFAGGKTNSKETVLSNNQVLLEKLDGVQTETDTEEVILNFLKEENEYILKDTAPDNNMGNKKIKFSYVNDNLKNATYKEHQLDDGGQLFFADDIGCIIVVYSNEKNDAELKSTQLLSTRAASSWKSKTYDKTFKFYSRVGLTCFKVNLGGKFKYNGKKSTAELTSASFNAPGLSPWEQTGWNTGEKDYSSSSKVYAFGTACNRIGFGDFSFDWNFINFTMKITCDKNGVIDYDSEYTKAE